MIYEAVMGNFLQSEISDQDEPRGYDLARVEVIKLSEREVYVLKREGINFVWREVKTTQGESYSL